MIEVRINGAARRFEASLDVAKRKSLFLEIQKYFIDNMIFIPSVDIPYWFGFQSYIRHFCHNLSGQPINRCSWDTWVDVNNMPADRRTR